MFPTRFCSSIDWTLDEVIARLQRSAMVDGVALFGSGYRADEPASDYDLLILLVDPPLHIFQMQTYINGVVCDVAVVDTVVADRTVALDTIVASISAEGFLLGWLDGAQIRFDREGRLARLQAKMRTGEWRTSSLNEAERYAEWFWLNFDLRQMKRLALSDDPLRLMTLDIRLMACASTLSRSYFRLRGWHWSGEKATLRVLQERDNQFFMLLQQFLGETRRLQRLQLCQQMITRTLGQSDALWPDGASALWLKDASEHPLRVGEALQIWDDLLAGKFYPPASASSRMMM